MRKIDFFIIFLFTIFFFGCGQSPQISNDSIKPPIEYNHTGNDGGIACDFLELMNAGKYSKAFKMFNKESYNYRPKKDIKSYWRHYSRDYQIDFSEPGMFKDADGNDVYSFPAMDYFGRTIINVTVENDKINAISIDSDFEAIEETYIYLINNQFDKITRMGTPEESEEEWNKIIEVTGKYISSNPPYYKSYIDKTAAFFPTVFEKGEFTIKFFHEQLRKEKSMSIYLIDDEK